jgi:uncharacterized protein YecE (DUF72 family)
MQKNDVIAALREMADLLEITDASWFEVMAYRNGAQALEDWFGDLDQAVADATLTEIGSIGKGLSRAIADLVRSGSCDELERVRSLVPRQLPALLRVRGLGPKRVRALWKELGIENPDDLRRAAAEGRVQALRGFGAKTVENILASLDYLRGAGDRPAKMPETPTSARPRAPTAATRIWVGTSGYSFSQWKGGFYPDDARPADFLELYAKRLPTVEINNTFYRFPSEKVIEDWKQRTPAGFRFALKANRRLTHFMRLGPSSRGPIVEFVERCAQLGPKLGCILFQLPPDFARDDARLETLLGSLRPQTRYAVEFRHQSWRVDEVQQMLRQHNVACVSGDAEGQSPQRWVTADFVYARLRRVNYTQDELSAWDEWFQAQTAEKREVLVYLKHDEEGAAPNIAAARWAEPMLPAARELLKESLARPARKSPKRGRKTG